MSNNGQLDHEQVKFPVSYTLKAILDNTIAEEKHIKELKSVLLKLEVAFQSFSSKLSSNGKYISISVNVKLENRKTFNELYVQLRAIPGIKYAL